MVVVEVDAIGPEPVERRPDRAAHVVGRAVRALAHVVTELRRQHDTVASALQQLAEEALAAAAVAVDVGRVEERDARVEGRVDDLARPLEVDPAAEVVAPEADSGDDEVRAVELLAEHPTIVDRDGQPA